jgi:hypothetical protein
MSEDLKSCIALTSELVLGSNHIFFEVEREGTQPGLLWLNVRDAAESVWADIEPEPMDRERFNQISETPLEGVVKIRCMMTVDEAEALVRMLQFALSAK